MEVNALMKLNKLILKREYGDRIQKDYIECIPIKYVETGTSKSS